MNGPRQQVDASVGLLYLVFGSACAACAYGYGLGTPARMGAGFFPFWLGLALAAMGLGALVCSRARHRPVQRLEPWAWKPLAWVFGALALFALLLPYAGLVLAVMMLVLVSSGASDHFRWRPALMNASALSAFSALLFVKGLGLPMPLWPTFFG